MQKTNYFEVLDELAKDCSRAIFLSLENVRSRLISSLKECEKIQLDALRKSCELELSLFGDFLPPIERHTIAELSHKLLKIIEKCIYIMCQKIQRPSNERKAKYNAELKALSQIIEESISMLKKIKKPGQTPNLNEFRKKVTETRKMLRAPHKKQGPQLLIYELCEDISDLFDKIVEIMLCNI